MEEGETHLQKHSMKGWNQMNNILERANENIQ